MTECTRKTLVFSRLNKQKIVADFHGGRLTSDAGALLPQEADRRTGLTRALCMFCGDRLLAAYLRPSRIDAAKHSRAILRLLVKAPTFGSW